MLLVGSNVFNVIDWNINGVEPCIGVALCTLPLAEIVSHRLQGPRFTLGLRFNPFSDRNEGFGIGWELTLPCILSLASGNRLLRLADGQRYLLPVTLPAIGQPVELVHKKTKVFKCVRSADDEFTLYYKNGAQDIVRAGRVREYRDSATRGVKFEWDSELRLTRIVEEGSNTALFEATPGSTTVTVRHRIHSITEARLDRYTLTTLPVEGGSALTTLQKVENINDTTPIPLYALEYEAHNLRYCYLKSVSQPFFFNRYKTFRYRTRQSPPGLSATLSYVDQQQVYCGAVADNTRVMTTTYRESRSNFLGLGSVAQWQNEQDNLHTLDDGFSFQMVETAPGLEIIRDYNKFGLLTQEKRQKAGATAWRQCHFYYGLAEGSLSRQSSVFDLVIYERRLFFSQGQTVPDRAVDLRYSYDEFANLLQHIAGNGTAEIASYYPASGETGNCPAEPQGFVRFVKTRRILPRGGSPMEQRYLYRHQTLSAATPGLIVLLDYTLTPSTINKVIEKAEYQYQQSGVFLGCLREEKLSYDVAGEAPLARSLIQYDREVKDATVWITTTRKALGGSGASIVNKTGQDVVTGEQVAFIHDSADAAVPGHKDTFTYDRFGRCTESIYAQGSTYQMTETCNYQWQQNLLSVTRTDRPKVHHETIYDRMGREILQKKVSHYEKEGQDKTLLVASEEKNYDAVGNLSWQQELDERLSADETSLWAVVKLRTQYQWNEFGDLVKTLHPDGSNDQIDYLQKVPDNSEAAYRITRTHLPGPRIITEDYDRWGNMIKKTTRATGNEQVVETYRYNGLNNVIYQENSLLGDKALSYDEFLRVTEELPSEGPSKFIIYTANTAEMLPYRLLVLDDTTPDVASNAPEEVRASVPQNLVVVGERSYDDFNRETQTVTNGVTTRREYRDKKNPWLVSHEYIGERTLTYEYIAELGVLSKVTAADASTLERDIRTEYQYDARRLLTREETAFSPIDVNLNNRRMQQVVKTFTYNILGDIKDETRLLVYTDDNIADERVTIHSSISTNGRLCLRINTLGGTTWREDYKFVADKGYLTRSLYQVNGKEVLQQDYSYSSQGQITRIAQIVEEQHYFSQRYKYDVVGRYTGRLYYKNTNERPNSTGVKYAETSFSYDAMDRMRETDYRFSECNRNAAAKETYFYTALGELNEWRRSGDIQLLDDYSNECTGQRIELDGLGNQRQVVTQRKNKPALTAKYTYESARPFSCQRIERLGFNDSTFTYDSEGGTQEELNLSNRTRYLYNAQGNLRSVRVTVPQGGSMRHNKFYLCDGNGEQHLMFSVSAEGRYQATQLLANDGKLAATYDLCMNDTSNRQTVIYHRCQGELLGITQLNAENQRHTSLEMAMPNGTSIARIGNFRRVARTIMPTQLNLRTYYLVAYHFTVDIVGSNAYGFAYRPQQLVYSREASKETPAFTLPAPFQRRLRRTG